MRRILFSILLVMLCTSVANVELTLEEWRQNKKFWMPHIVGIATGLQWANNAVELSGQKPLFCVPPKLTINVESLETIIEQAIHSDPLLARGSFMGLVLLVGFKDTFPCGKGK